MCMTRDKFIEQELDNNSSVSVVNNRLEDIGFRKLSDVEIFLYTEKFKKNNNITRIKCINKGLKHNASTIKVNRILALYNFDTLTESEENQYINKLQTKENNCYIEQTHYWKNFIGKGKEFENAIAIAFKKQGFFVEHTQNTGDHGIDLFLKKDNETTIIQCKAHNSKIQEGTARDLNGTLHSKYAKGAKKAILISINGFTKDCIQFMEENGIEHLSLRELCCL